MSPRPWAAYSLPFHQVSHLRASPEASPRVYRATMSPCFQRPWFWTAAFGAPAATILRAMPIRPLCPEKSSPRPAALATARIQLAFALLDRDASCSIRPEFHVVPQVRAAAFERRRPPSAITPTIARSMVPRACAASADSMPPSRPRRGRQAVSRIRARAWAVSRSGSVFAWSMVIPASTTEYRQLGDRLFLQFAHRVQCGIGVLRRLL